MILDADLSGFLSDEKPEQQNQLQVKHF